MGDEIVVRDVRPADGAALSRIWLDVAKYYVELDPDAFQVPDEEGLAQWFENDLREDLPDNWRTLVAEVRGEPAGWVTGHVEPPHPHAGRNFVRSITETRLVVDALIVAPSLWRNGVGSRLMGKIEEWARSQGASLSTLDTYVHSPVSVPFYETRMGYERRSLNFVKQLRPEWACRFRWKEKLCSGGVCRAEALSKADVLCVSVEVALPEHKVGHDPVDHGAHE